MAQTLQRAFRVTVIALDPLAGDALPRTFHGHGRSKYHTDELGCPCKLAMFAVFPRPRYLSELKPPVHLNA